MIGRGTKKMKKEERETECDDEIERRERKRVRYDK